MCCNLAWPIQHPIWLLFTPVVLQISSAKPSPSPSSYFCLWVLPMFAATLNSLAYPQPCFSFLPAGAAAQWGEYHTGKEKTFSQPWILHLPGILWFTLT